MTTEPTPQKDRPRNAREAVTQLMAGAFVSLEWEIDLLKLIPDAKEKLLEFQKRKIPNQVNLISSLAEQEIYVDQIAAALGRTRAAVEDLLDTCIDLFKELSDTYGMLRDYRGDPRKIAEHIYGWFIRSNGKFFKTKDEKVWLFFRGHTFEINNNNIAFNALMDKLTRLSAISAPGKDVWYYLRMISYDRGAPIDKARWMYTDREKDAVYLNLNSPHHKIICLRPGEEPKVVDNGTNEDGVLLADSMEIRPFEYNQAADEAEGFRELKSLLMETTPCERAQQYFYICWLISTFLIDYQSDRGLMQVIAHTKVGKSKVAERASQLVYGVNLVGKGTGAAETRIATNSPMVFQDNLENRNLTQGVVDFLLFVANSAHKPKSKSGSDTDVLYQQLNTLCIITSIEAFPGKLSELINRTFPLMLEARYKSHGYMHDETMRAIAKKRNLILSSIFKMITKKVLPKLGERRDWSKHLNTVHPGHNKDRMNEHLCLILLILEGVLEYLPIDKEVPIKKQASGLLEHWITYQEAQAHETSVDSNTLLTYLNGLAKEVMIKMRGKSAEDLPFIEDPKHHGKLKVKIYEDPEYWHTFYLSDYTNKESDDDENIFEVEEVQYFDLIVSSAELQDIFDRYCGALRRRNHFEGPSALGARISNDREVLEKGGWDIIGGAKSQRYYKKIRGTNYWRLRKTVRVSW